MPSLAHLEEFKASFQDIGGEAIALRNNPMLAEDFELPDDDPPSPFPEDLIEGPIIDLEPALKISDLGLDLPPESFTGSGDSGSGFDFGDFLGDSSLDAGSSPDSFDSPDSFGSPESFNGLDNLGLETAESGEASVPDDLLSGFSDDLEAGGLPIDENLAPAEDFPIDEGFSMGAENFPESAEQESAEQESADIEDFPLEELPEENSGLDTVNIESFDIPEDAPSGESEFSGLEFPDIDLTQAVDMGGEAITSPTKAAGDDDFAFPTGDDSSFELPDDGGFAIPEDMGETGSLAEPLPDTDDFAMALPDNGDFGAETSGEAGADNFGADDFGTGDFGAGDFGTDIGPADDMGLPDTGSALGMDGTMDFGGEDLSANFDSVLEPDTDSFAELPPPDDSEETGADSFDTFTAGDDWNVPAATLETPDFNAAATEEFGDFSLAGFDDTGGGKQGKAAEFAPLPGGAEEVEEIQLNEADYRHLQDTLSAYPLNLRIACEELIAEQAVAPDQMSALIKLLVRGAPAKETASLAGKILGRTITIPKGYAKQTGEELEAEQASFGYIFTKRFLPVLRLAGAIALVAGSLGYLIWQFGIIPIQAERRYKEGYALIQTGEYVQANERFRQALEIHKKKNWFYLYANAFRDERQYIYAERKYDELLRLYPRDKKGALEYAAMETYYIKNYEKADRILRTNILDYAVNDREGLLALAENSLAWGEFDNSRYEEARSAFARLMEKYGKQDPYLEGMLKYFIRTDKLEEVLPLQAHFMSDPKKRKISVPTLAELGGYLLDKRYEERTGVPEEYADEIEGIRAILIRAINADGSYPESYYHLARYYSRYGNVSEERNSLRDAIRAFAAAPEESPRRIGYYIDTQRRYAEVLINSKEFFPAEEELIRGVRLYEDARARGVLKVSRPEFGRLYANLGDLEFFVKSGDMAAALRYYQEAERNGWSPPEIQYRMGAAHYQNGQWEDALMRFFALTPVMPNNKRLLYALGNTAYLRGNYFTAQGYYNHLMDLIDAERIRFPNLFPGGRPEELELAERIMVADNNLGVTLEALTRVSGDSSYRTRALYFFSESIRAWDVLTRNPESMARMQPIKDLYSPGINLAYLNTQNILHPSPNYEQQIFMRIDRDCLEPSDWETLVPRNYRLSDQLQPPGIE